MELIRCWSIVWMLLCFSFPILHAAANSDMSIESLDSTVRDCAFHLPARAQTGQTYQLSLPSRLSGVRASAVRLRSGTLWRNGAAVGAFRVRPRTLRLGVAIRRITLVYQDLGNWSSSFYSVPGYSFVAPVVGLLAYDASDGPSPSSGIRQLQLGALGEAITVTFPEVRLPEGLNATIIRCVVFGPHGDAQLGGSTTNGACSTKNAGHFALVVPSIIPGAAPAPVSNPGWKVPSIAVVGGAAGLVLVGVAGVGISRLLRHKRMEEMESQADEDEALGTTWFGSSKMPYAAMTRTQPVLEDGRRECTLK